MGYVDLHKMNDSLLGITPPPDFPEEKQEDEDKLTKLFKAQEGMKLFPTFQAITNDDLDEPSVHLPEPENTTVDNFDFSQNPTTTEEADPFKPFQIQHVEHEEQETTSGGPTGTPAFNKAYDAVEAEDPDAAKYRKLLTYIAEKESGFNPGVRNKAGYPAWGYFQMMQGTHGGSSWNNIDKYAGTSINTFLHDPKIQIKAAIKLAKAFTRQFSQQDLQSAQNKGITMNGLIGGAWLAGVGGVKAYLHNGQNRSDGSTTVSQRIRLTNFA